MIIINKLKADVENIQNMDDIKNVLREIIELIEKNKKNVPDDVFASIQNGLRKMGR